MREYSEERFSECNAIKKRWCSEDDLTLSALEEEFVRELFDRIPVGITSGFTVFNCDHD